MLQTTEIEVGDIICPESMLMRVKTDKPTIRQYAKAMEGGAVFPPVLCYRIGDELILADGFHRVEAYRSIGVEKIQADVRIGTMDDAIIAAVRANAHDGLPRSNADKEKTVRALLGSEKWCGLSDRQIAQEAAVNHKTVGKLRKVSIQVGNSPPESTHVHKSILGKDGKRYPAKKPKPEPKLMPSKADALPAPPPVLALPAPAPSGAAASLSKPPPLPKFTREQLGAPSAETENEQDPDSAPGVTRAMAHTMKYGHVHIRPLDERLRAEQEKKVTGFIALLRDLEKPAAELMKHAIDPDQFLATLRDIKGTAMTIKFRDRMASLEPLVSHLNALCAALRATKNAA
jgi:hypothetical protein